MNRNSSGGARQKHLNLGALAVSLTDATGISRQDAMDMPYGEFLLTYQDALIISEERKKERKRQRNQRG